MASVGFYHLTKTSLEQALPALLTRTMQVKEHGLVLCKDDQQVKILTEALWRITHPVWLPHGCHTSKHQDTSPEWQPIWLTIFEENLNEAAFLFLVGGQSLIGLKVHNIDLKDVILPGEMREIFNQVVSAEKQAEANVIRRREETNATRSLLNTAKVMADNPIMLRLKELESLESIAGKVDHLTVHNGTDGLMNDLVKLRNDK